MGNFYSSTPPDAVNEDTPGDFADFIRSALHLCQSGKGEVLYDKYFLSDAYFGPYEVEQDAKRKKLRDALVKSAVSQYLPWLKKAKRVGEEGMVDETEHRADLKIGHLRDVFFGMVPRVSRILGLYSDEVQRTWPNSVGSFFLVKVEDEWKIFIPYPFDPGVLELEAQERPGVEDSCEEVFPSLHLGEGPLRNSLASMTPSTTEGPSLISTFSQ